MNIKIGAVSSIVNRLAVLGFATSMLLRFNFGSYLCSMFIAFSFLTMMCCFMHFTVPERKAAGYAAVGSLRQVERGTYVAQISGSKAPSKSRGVAADSYGENRKGGCFFCSFCGIERASFRLWCNGVRDISFRGAAKAASISGK